MTVRGNIEAIYPLTPVQDGILFHVLYAPESPLYFQQYTAVLEGRLDIDLFRQAWQQVIGRHESMRSLLTWERRDRPLQIVRAAVEPEWLVEEWPPGDHDDRLAAFLSADRERGFDLSVAPLMRFALFELDEQRYRFVWSHHHVVIDGWSMGIVLDEVFRSYAALAGGTEPSLPPPADYRAYHAWLDRQDRGPAEAHWRRVLAGFDSATSLRIDAGGPATPWAEHHAEELVTISADRTASLVEVARRNGLTLNTMLRGAWALLLHRYSGSDDVLFGATVSGRPPEVTGALDLVGMFINTLPVRVRIDHAMSLLDWLRQIQADQLATTPFESTPLVDVQRWSDVPQGDPLFTTLLVFENVPTRNGAGDGLRTSDVRYLQRSNYPLAVLVMPEAAMELIFLYDADRFDREVIRRLARQLDHLLTAMGDDLARPLGQISILPPEEATEMLVTWNDASAEVPADRTMHELILETAAHRPDRVAVTDGEVAVSYADLATRAQAIAGRLIAAGVAPGDRVGVCMPRSPAMVVAIVGVMCAGAAYVPMDPSQPAPRLRYVLDDTDAVAVVLPAGDTAPETGRRLTEIRVDVGGVPTGELGSPGSLAAGTPDDLAYVLFTSGSTGRPKGVAVSHHNLVSSTHVRRQVYPGRVDAFLLVSPLIFDSSLVGLFWTLYDGGTIVLPAPQTEQDVRGLARLVAQHRVTHTLALPSLYELLLEHAASDELSSLRVVMVAGEPCPPRVVERHLATLPTTLLFNEYGPTEATVWCTVHQITSADVTDSSNRRVPIGRPIPNTQIYVLDAGLRPVPVGVPGELCVAGDGLTQGYLGHPELTDRHFVDHALPEVGRVRMYRTGDLARFLPDGTIDLIGRIDHQVKIRGQRIELGEVELALSEHPDVQEAAAALHRPNGGGPPVLVAYVAGRAAPEALRTHLAERLPEAMVPSIVEVLDELPHGATGKIDRNALPAPRSEPRSASTSEAAPRSPAETTLAEIWAEVLGIESVGVFDNFFELGGDSILSIRIIARAHEAGLTLTPRQFFETPTIAELAASLE